MKNDSQLQCPICTSKNIKKKLTKLRDKSEQNLFCCQDCCFQYFDKFDESLIKQDEYEISRLRSAGLEIPSENKDFENGYEQSEIYIDKHIPKKTKNLNILEIGCSTGYFLKRIIDLKLNHCCSGIELNPSRARYVRENLDIDCFSNLNEIKLKKKYDLIFMFYVLEYINNPFEYISNLIDYLNIRGKLIIYTPNTNDVLKDIWQIDEFKDFFYEKQAINYFCKKTFEKLQLRLNRKDLKFKIETFQAYSLFNHLRWFFERKPKTTGIVGGDKIDDDIKENLNKDTILGKEFINFFETFNKNYKKIIEQKDFGNRIFFEITKI